jgi:hypothetical protein
LTGKDAQADPATSEIIHRVDEMPEIAPESVELPDDKHIALPQRLQTGGEARPLVVVARSRVAVNAPLGDAGGHQCVPLKVERLRAVGFGDTSVSD